MSTSRRLLTPRVRRRSRHDRRSPRPVGATHDERAIGRAVGAGRRDPPRSCATTMAEQHMKAVIVSVNVDGKNVLTEAFGDIAARRPRHAPTCTSATARSPSPTSATCSCSSSTRARSASTTPSTSGCPICRTPTRSRCGCWRTRPRAIPTSSRIRRGSRRTTRTRTTAGRSRNGSQYVLDRPRPFAPGENWSYSHTNFMILGEVLAEDRRSKPLDTLLQNKVLEPLGLKHTIETETSADPGPGPALVQRRATQLLRRPVDHAVLRGRDVLEHAVGDADGREPDHEDRRHDQDRRSPSAPASSCRSRATRR